MDGRPRGGHLHGLAEAHLVGEDAVEAVLVEGDEPLHPVHLVAAHHPARHQPRLPRVPLRRAAGGLAGIAPEPRLRMGLDEALSQEG